MSTPDRRLTSQSLFHILKPILGLPDSARRVVITLEMDMAAIVEVEQVATTTLNDDYLPTTTQTYYLWPNDNEET